jgi:hypothetical protein
MLRDGADTEIDGGASGGAGGDADQGSCYAGKSARKARRVRGNVLFGEAVDQ